MIMKGVANDQRFNSHHYNLSCHHWYDVHTLWCCPFPAKQLVTSMNKVIGPLRRAALYGSISYLGLVVINNSGLDLPSLWLAYLPMFLGVYAL